MSATPDALKALIAGGAGTGAKPTNPIAAAGPHNTPPPGGPMTTPQPKAGLKASAMTNIAAVFDLLEQSLMTFGTESKEGQVVHQALGILTKQFGAQRQQHQGLIPAELRQLNATTPSMGGGSAPAKAMAATPPVQAAAPPPPAA